MDGLILRWNGAAWTRLESGLAVDFRAVAGTGPDDVWIAGGRTDYDVSVSGKMATVLHWDGTSLDGLRSGSADDLSDVWSAGAADTWAVGAAGVYRRGGEAWILQPPAAPPGRPLALHGSSAAEVWAVGRHGETARWDGAAWSVVDSGTTEDLRGVWAVGPGDVWAAGDVPHHWDGTAWTRSTVAVPPEWMEDVCASSADDVWAIDDWDTVYRWDGAAWVRNWIAPTAQDLRGYELLLTARDTSWTRARRSGGRRKCPPKRAAA